MIPALRANPRLLGLGVIAGVLLVAAVLTQAHVRLASSQVIAVGARQTEETVPLDDPRASIWESVAPVEIPLSAQQAAIPMGGGGIRAIAVRALHDDKRIYFRLEWDDQTKDMSAFAPQSFRDAAAIELPADGVSTLPSFCMGQTGGQVNIWHWKADWQADIDSGFVSVPQTYPNAAADLYPFQDDNTFYAGRAAGNILSQTSRNTPVENLVASGFGTLSTGEGQMVGGKGVWDNGKWYVLFDRAMEAQGDTYAPLEPGQKTNVAFAVWDGSKGERDGIKSVSQFADLSVEGAGGGGANIPSIVILGLLLAVAVGAAGYVIYNERLKKRA